MNKSLRNVYDIYMKLKTCLTAYKNRFGETYDCTIQFNTILLLTWQWQWNEVETSSEIFNNSFL